MNPENLIPSLEEGITGFASSAQATAKFEAGKDHASQAASELKEAAILKAQAVKSSAVLKAEDVRRKVEDRVQDARSRCEQRTRNEPLKCLLYAFGIGFVTGYIFRR